MPRGLAQSPEASGRVVPVKVPEQPTIAALHRPTEANHLRPWGSPPSIAFKIRVTSLMPLLGFESYQWCNAIVQSSKPRDKCRVFVGVFVVNGIWLFLLMRTHQVGHCARSGASPAEHQRTSKNKHIPSEGGAANGKGRQCFRPPARERLTLQNSSYGFTARL